ncbi:MAG: CAP domain-containing protein [Anaerolineae bacterium]
MRPCGDHRRLGIRVGLWLLATALLFAVAQPILAQDDPRGHFLDLLNQLRLSEGLAPLGNSTLLNQAAQRHAEDLVTQGVVTHEGSDGSSYQQRIREARYHAWNDGLMVDEVLWTGLGTAEDAVIWFRNNAEWAVLTDPRYREVGIGYADDHGIRYFVVDLGSRPGVLPIFINDGAETTEAPQVALRLTNEEAVPLGDGTWMGTAIEVRVSNTPDFDGQPWQPWEPLLPWMLSGQEPGDYAVYVEFRDGAARTAIAEDLIRLVPPGESPPTPTPFTDTGPVTPSSEEPTAAPEATDAAPSPELTPASARPTAAPRDPISSTGEIALPSESETYEGLLTPYPTWTPLASDELVAVEREPTDWPLLAVFVLQAVAVLLGAAAFLKRH